MKNNDAVKNILILAVLVYFSGDMIIMLINHGWPFEVTQWLMSLIVLACIILAILVFKRMKNAIYKTNNKEEE